MSAALGSLPVGRRLLGVGAALAGLVVAASGCGLSLQTLPQIGGTASGYTLHAVFDNVQDLAANAEVREGDAVVGRVTSIRARNYQAIVGMTIEHGVTIPAATTAEARFSTPLGDEYIALTVPAPGTAASLDAALAPGATIPDTQTAAAPSVADTFAALAAVLYGGGLQQAETVVSELNQVLGGRGPEIGTLLVQLDTTVTSLASNDTSIDNALTEVGHISGQVNAGSASLVAALDTLPAAAQTLTDNTSALDQLLQGINKLAPAVTSVLQTSGANLVSDTQQLAPVAAQLARIQDQIGRDLADVDKFTALARRVAPAGYAQVDVDFVGLFPAALCVPHLVAGTNPEPCTSLDVTDPGNPSVNYVPPLGLSTDSAASTPAPSSSSASSASPVAGALSQLETSVP